MKSVRKPDNKEFTTVYNATEVHNVLRSVNPAKEYDEYRELWQKASSLSYVPDYPLQLDFELNYSCNFSCSMCTWSVESSKGKGKKTWFDFEVYKEVIDEGVAKGLKAVRLNYVNEPLIRKDIHEFIAYAREAGILDIYFSTNGSLLTEAMSIALIDSGLTILQISLDAATKETFDKIRQGGDFHKIIANIARFKDIRTELKSLTPLLRVNFVKTALNISELEIFLEYWEDKADSIGVQNLIDVNHPADEKQGIDNSQSFNCAQPFCHLTIRYNGNILPCCTFFGAAVPISQLATKHSVEFSDVENMAVDKKSQAQLISQTIEQAWKGSAINKFREIHKVGEYWKHPVCKKCVLSSSHVDETQ